MSFCNYDNRFSCTGLAVVASIIIGIITAFLRITAVITLTPVFLWVVLGISIIYLAVLLVAAAIVQRTVHCCYAVGAVLAGILGSVLFSIVLLAITFAATSIVGAIIAGLLLFFLSLTITATACLVNCLLNCNN